MHRRSSPGFTLIELLVVVAIIALLLAILLPSLRKAREQGRIAVCLSNLKSIGQAAATYLTDQKTLMFAVPANYLGPGRPTVTLFTECIWGGGVPDRRSEDYARAYVGFFDPTEGGGFRTDVYIIPPEERPLNKYMFPEWSEPTRVLNHPDRVNFPYKPPGVFRCPSDWHALLPNAGRRDPIEPFEAIFRTWEWWGTSYPINWYWPYYYTGPRRGRDPNFLAYLRGRSAKILQREADRGPSEFILFYENAMNYPVESAAPRGAPNNQAKVGYVGWHRALDKYTAAFLDGHAVYRKFDTRYPDGPGWTTWLHRPWDDVHPGWKPYENN